jgi:glycosyltransferase involved in cell wall biosynthesis
MPKVSVCVVTYNQADYIRECLLSLVEQKTDFAFEVVVGDDCSTDGTRAIVQEFADRYPGVVRPIFRERNIGAYGNFISTHQQAMGEFVAHMDGDDLALPGKLQRQADCLDADPAVSFSTHAVRIVGTDKVIGGDPSLPTNGTIHDLLRIGTYFVNSSVMYRKSLESPHPAGFEAVDYFMHIERAVRGYIHLDRSVLGCYRVHNGGISRDPQHRERIERFYDAAFDRAIELGVDRNVVQSARLRRRMVQGIARYLSGDPDGYREKIRLAKEDIMFASLKHRILHWTRRFPWGVAVYFRLRTILAAAGSGLSIRRQERGSHVDI